MRLLKTLLIVAAALACVPVLNQLGGVLATIVPEDKKIIHGMKDAILVPCRVAAAA